MCNVNSFKYTTLDWGEWFEALWPKDFSIVISISNLFCFHSLSFTKPSQAIWSWLYLGLYLLTTVPSLCLQFRWLALAALTYWSFESCTWSKNIEAKISLSNSLENVTRRNRIKKRYSQLTIGVVTSWWSKHMCLLICDW